MHAGAGTVVASCFIVYASTLETYHIIPTLGPPIIRSLTTA